LANDSAEGNFTLLLVNFQNDPSGKAHGAIATEVRNQYPINVIESCITINIDQPGDPDEKSKRQRDKLLRLLNRKNADVVIFGYVHDQTDIEIVTLYRSTIPYSFNRNVAWKDTIKNNKEGIHAYVSDSKFRGEILNAATDDMARFKPCPVPLWGVCNEKDLGKSLVRLKSVIKIYDDRAGDIISDKSENFDYRRLLRAGAWTNFFWVMSENSAENLSSFGSIRFSLYPHLD
jgi:hypothetical protein